MVSTTVRNVLHKAVTVVILSIITQDIYCLPSFNFSDPIQIVPKCGLRHGVDYWTTEVTVTHKATLNFSVNFGGTLICLWRTRRECPRLTSQDVDGDTCYCTGETADTSKFKLVIRRKARVKERGRQLRIGFRTEHNVGSEKIGHIPATIYKPVNATYCVDEYIPISPLKPVQNVTVTSLVRVGVLFCVANLLDGSRLSINGNSSSPMDGCLFQVMLPPDAPVVLSYRETKGCRRNDTFYLNIHVRARTTTTTVRSAEREPSMTLGAIVFFILLTISVVSALFVWCVYLQKNYDIFNRGT